MFRWDLFVRNTFRQIEQKASAWKILFGVVRWSIFPFDGCFLFNERDLFDVFNERDRLEDLFVSSNFKLKSKTPVVFVGLVERFSSLDWDDKEPSSQFKLIWSDSSSRFCSAATWYWVRDDDESEGMGGLSRTACSNLNKRRRNKCRVLI